MMMTTMIVWMILVYCFDEAIDIRTLTLNDIKTVLMKSGNGGDNWRKRVQKMAGTVEESLANFGAQRWRKWREVCCRPPPEIRRRPRQVLRPMINVAIVIQWNCSKEE
jgi:hypothetical protein